MPSPYTAAASGVNHGGACPLDRAPRRLRRPTAWFCGRPAIR